MGQTCLLFTLVCLVKYVPNRFSTNFMQDDQQIYLSFKPGPVGVQSAQDDCIHHMERCTEEIRNWMARNMLKLNDEKTEFIIFGTHQQLKKNDHITIRIGSKNTVPAEHVRNLGFLMDKLCKNTKHISYLSSLLCHQLRNIWNIRGKLDFKAAKTVVQALILSELDYCNSLLVGTPESNLFHLQCIQNMACRVVCNLRKHDHVSASMNSLHWLGVRECITYKIAYLVHCCKMRTAPQYLIDVLPMATHNRSLRSSTSGNLQSTKCRTSLAKQDLLVQLAQRYGTVYHLMFEP